MNVLSFLQYEILLEYSIWSRWEHFLHNRQIDVNGDEKYLLSYFMGLGLLE